MTADGADDGVGADADAGEGGGVGAVVIVADGPKRRGGAAAAQSELDAQAAGDLLIALDVAGDENHSRGGS